MKVIRSAALFAALSVLASVSFATEPLSLPGLQAEVTLLRDRAGVAHIYARNDHDVYFTHGYVHAADRFFQMDASRRQASGTLAELLGPGALPSDVQLRTLGLRRAAERSLAAYPPDVRAVLQAYADGVNAWLAQGSLPPEYAALELKQALAWTPLDTVTVAKLLAFGLSFDTIDPDNTRALMTYQAVGGAVGFNGTRLFFDDLFRSAPFDPTISIPEGVVSGPVRDRGRGQGHEIDFDAAEKARRFLERPHGVPFFAPEGRGEGGSNWWIISGRKTESRNAMLASDPHLSLSSPSVFHEVHLNVRRGPKQEPLNVYGVGFPGVPGVVHGFNDRIMWGSTVNPMDVTDYYQERVVVDGLGRLNTFFRGALEPIVVIPETYRLNAIGDGIADTIVNAPPGSVPAATLVVPRRNNGPLLTAPSGSPLTAISVQYTGFSATREIETFLRFGRAGTVEEFKQALQFFDVGSQNWGYADVDGNIAYFTSAELPLREDLQAGTVEGLPPYFIRDGTGTLHHEWIRQDSRPADQAIPYAILPFDEMPQLVNPARGYIANGNNDPIGVTLDNNPLNKLRVGGQGILYLSPGYAIGNRVARIDRRIRAELGEISFEDMIRIQADVKLLDAEVLRPHILRAFDSACLAGAPAMLAAFCHDAAIAEAVSRLRRWDFSTPTGLAEGYDAADRNGKRSKPTREEIANSVAATIYSVWRGQALRSVIDATLARISALTGVALPQPPGDRAMIALRHLLESFPESGSGLNFFDVPGVTLAPAAERDIVLLQSLKGALDLLASPAFASAFGQSTDQDDYRWGKLHRIVLRHPMNTAPFNIGPLAIDGGFDVVDASSHNPRANTVDGFMFSSGPSKRFVGEARRSGIHAVQVIPGGASGDPRSPSFGSLVELWATNDYHEASSDRGDALRNAVSVQVLSPAAD
jgi:penicillin amidase